MIVERLVKTWTSCTEGLAMKSWLFYSNSPTAEIQSTLDQLLSINEQFFLPF